MGYIMIPALCLLHIDYNIIVEVNAIYVNKQVCNHQMAETEEHSDPQMK